MGLAPISLNSFMKKCVMNYRLISLDVDGTLLNDQGNLLPANRSTLLAARAQGIHIILNTGKPACTLIPLIDQLDIHDPAITLTGGLIVQYDNQKNWQIIKGYPISPSALQLLAFLFQNIPLNLFVFLENRNLIYVNHHDSATNDYLKHLLEKTNFQPYEMLNYSPLLDADVLAQPVYKVMVNSNDENQIETLYAHMRRTEIPGIQFHISAFGTIDIHAQETSKMIAMQYIANQLRVPSTQVIALGDNETDLDVVCWAGFGAIMANGPDSIRVQAPHIAPANQEAGVAYIVNQYLLKE